MQIRISNPKILAFFNFRVLDGRRCSVEQPLSIWLRCLWSSRLDFGAIYSALIKDASCGNLTPEDLKITITDENGDFIRNDHGAEKLS